MTVWEGDHPAGELLSALADAELDPSEAEEVWEHTAACGGCARDLAGLSDIRSRVRALPAPVPPADFETLMIGRIRQIERAEATGGRRARAVVLRRRAAATAAVVAAVAAATVITFLPHPSSTTPAVGRMVESHLTSSGGGDPSNLAPAAVPAGFGR